jgi:hypothetical protein
MGKEGLARLQESLKRGSHADFRHLQTLKRNLKLPQVCGDSLRLNKSSNNCTESSNKWCCAFNPLVDVELVVILSRSETLTSFC